MATVTTKATAERKTARQVVRMTRQGLIAARVRYARVRREWADLHKGYHTAAEEDACDLARQDASTEKGRAAALYHRAIARLKSLTEHPTPYLVR